MGTEINAAALGLRISTSHFPLPYSHGSGLPASK